LILPNSLSSDRMAPESDRCCGEIRHAQEQSAERAFPVARRRRISGQSRARARLSQVKGRLIFAIDRQ